MAEQSNPHGERESIISIDADELQEKIRGDFGDPNPQSPTIVEGDKEPDIVVDQESRAAEPSPDRAPVVDERLQAAFNTIESLKREQESLRQEVRTRTAPQYEPNIEMMDTPLGIPIPKNPQHRFVQLTPEQVQAVGLDPAATEPLNILANVFYSSLSNTLPGVSVAAMQEIQRRNNDAAARYNSFFSRFPDLQDHSELVEAVEHSARERENVHRQYAGNEYGTQIAKRARFAIARMRGITLADYERSVAQGQKSNGQQTPTSRAVSARGGKHRPVQMSEQQKEMDI